MNHFGFSWSVFYDIIDILLSAIRIEELILLRHNTGVDCTTTMRRTSETRDRQNGTKDIHIPGGVCKTGFQSHNVQRMNVWFTDNPGKLLWKPITEQKNTGEYYADLIEELTSAKAAMPKQIVNHQLPHSSVVYNLPGVLQFE